MFIRTWCWPGAISAGPPGRRAAGPPRGIGSAFIAWGHMRASGEDLRGVGRVDEVEGGAVLDERDVVGVRQLLVGRAGQLAETDREHGGAHRVPEGLSGAEVGGDR